MKRSVPSFEKALKLFQSNQLPAALKEAKAYLAGLPNDEDALQLCGAICSDLGRHEDAIELLGRAVTLRPRNVGTHYNLGKAQMAAGNIADALQSFEAGLQLQPRMPELLSSSANALTEQHRFDEAFVRFKAAIAANPKFTDAHYGLGRALMIKGAFAEARAAFLACLAIDGQDHQARLNAFACGLEIADWQDFDRLRDALRKHILEGNGETPFNTLLLFDDSKIHLTCARADLGRRRTYRPSPPALDRAPRRLRVAYVSADFCAHPTSRLLVGMIEKHDRAAFEIVGVSIGEGSGASSPPGQRIRRAFDTFIDMPEASTAAIRDAFARLDIDIAIDLMGHTQNARPDLFQSRLAPVQINYLGYPGPSGNAEMDYIVTDPFIDETFDAANYTERPIVLPQCYQPNDDRRPIPAAPLSRTSYGLPETAFVFCCFNEPRKITPDTFDSWMRILNAAPSSVLWLYAPLEAATQNLQRAAEKRGIDPSRLIFCGRVKHEEHLARYAAADLFLDTFPYTAHTTASDALWSGCPLLTRVGKSFPSRVAASILTTYGLPELITRSIAEFEAVAGRLANNRAELEALRKRITPADRDSSVFDTARYTRNFEAGLQAVWSRREAGDKPGRIKL